MKLIDRIDTRIASLDGMLLMAIVLMATLIAGQIIGALVGSVMASLLDSLFDMPSATHFVIPTGLLFAFGVCLWLVRRNLLADEGVRPVDIGLASSRLGIAASLGLVVLLYFGASFLAGAYAQLVGYEGQKTMTEMIRTTGGDNIAARGLMVFSVVIMGPVVEELVFRGYLQSGLTKRFGPYVGIGISSVVFAGYHFQPEAFVVLLVVGAAFGLAYHLTRSLWPAILLHMLNNAAFIVNLFYFEGTP
ncbi:CPBP family intramembrane glutamic endopeptidase [Kordiimonas aestuarii]|uniref:CPBP family intramembrane glutamic endopeptidase n=1 Tax=Kordiimonas aestuarii TaxID=1005925 RepID=UPI0021CFD4CB|nr:CPBP family intramembrane glutamic endopeptidase [Kordiimonas aestuarii]